MKSLLSGQGVSNSMVTSIHLWLLMSAFNPKLELGGRGLMKSMKREPWPSKFLWSEFHQTLGQARMSEQGREKFGRLRTSYLLSSLSLSFLCLWS